MDEIRISEAEFTKQSLQNFLRVFPDEDACLSHFPLICKACGLENEAKIPQGRSFKCSKCNTNTWRTAGTYFHGLKKLLPTFARIWLYEDRAVLSTKKFSEI